MIYICQANFRKIPLPIAVEVAQLGVCAMWTPRGVVYTPWGKIWVHAKCNLSLSLLCDFLHLKLFGEFFKANSTLIGPLKCAFGSYICLILACLSLKHWPISCKASQGSHCVNCQTHKRVFTPCFFYIIRLLASIGHGSGDAWPIINTNVLPLSLLLSLSVSIFMTILTANNWSLKAKQWNLELPIRSWPRQGRGNSNKNNKKMFMAHTKGVSCSTSATTTTTRTTLTSS